jgi:hypothetical protein
MTATGRFLPDWFPPASGETERLGRGWEADRQVVAKAVLGWLLLNQGAEILIHAPHYTLVADRVGQYHCLPLGTCQAMEILCSRLRATANSLWEC